MPEPKQAAIPLPGPEPKPAVGKNSLVVNTSAAILMSLVFKKDIKQTSLVLLTLELSDNLQNILKNIVLKIIY